MMRLCPIKYGVNISPIDIDPCAAELISLLHMNGTNTGTTFTDETGKIWSVFGNAQTSTTESIFNGSSGKFDGTGDYISTPSTADWQIHKDGVIFTLEAFVWIDSTSSTVQIATNNNIAGPRGFSWYVTNLRDMRFVFASASPWSCGTVPTDQWVHVAIVCTRKDFSGAGDYEFLSFIGGVLTSTHTTDLGATDIDTAYPVYIGMAQNGTAGFEGYIAEFRATQCVRYTADFTPPTAPFPNP